MNMIIALVAATAAPSSFPTIPTHPVPASTHIAPARPAHAAVPTAHPPTPGPHRAPPAPPILLLTPLPTMHASAQPSPLPQASAKAESALARSVLERYEAQFATTHTPKTMTFEYTVEQAGDRSLTQAHRIYRSGNLERDETFGSTIAKSKPKIHLFRNRPNAYSFENVAPRKTMYTFSLVGTVHVGTHAGYLFRTAPLNRLSAFTVTDVAIDAVSYLPAVVNFTTLSATATGRGSLRYSAVEKNWIITEAEATAMVGKKRLREHFVFTNYRFPETLPASTFGNI